MLANKANRITTLPKDIHLAKRIFGDAWPNIQQLEGSTMIFLFYYYLTDAYPIYSHAGVGTVTFLLHTT